MSMAELDTLAFETSDADAPLYQRVKDAIAHHIADGTLEPGAQLPSERSLCERFGISRVTARRALAALVDDGLVVSSPSRGWYVAEGSLFEPPNALLSFTSMARARGFNPTARVVSREVRPSNLDEAETLQIAPGAEVLALERVRLLDDLPVAVHRSLTPLALCPALAEVDFTDASLYEVLMREARVVATAADCTVEATSAGTAIAALLDVDASAPVLVSRQITLDSADRPIEMSTIIYRGDRYRFRTRQSAESQAEEVRTANWY